MPIKTRLALTAGIVAAFAGFGTSAQAQSESDASRSGLEDIVVTATRREEKLLDVPVAVTALSADTLVKRQIVDVENLQRIAPSLVAAPFGDAGSQLLAIRGQVAQDIVASVDPAVGIYVDGVYLGRFTGGNLSFVDVERVEVLRGPQGTLFGRNTIGGAVSITPNHPTDKFEGMASARYGNYNALGLTGMVNLPIADGIAFRLAGNHIERDGFARSAITGADLNAQNQEFLRGSLKADLAPGWDLLVSGDFTHMRNSGHWFTNVKTFPLADTVARAATGNPTETTAQYADKFTRRPTVTTSGPSTARSWGTSAILSGEIGTVNVKSITAYRKLRRGLFNLDQDGTPFELLQIISNKSRQHQFSQELQLYGKAFDDRLDWIVGAYYFKEKGSDEVIGHFDFPLSTAQVITAGTAFNRNIAVFGQATYKLTDQFEVVGGIRYAKDSRRLDLTSRNVGAQTVCAVSGATPPACLVALPKKSFDYVPFTLGVNFKPNDDTLVYAKWSRGFRSGGYNTRGVSQNALLPFGPEKVDSYELGAKLEIANMVRISADVFQSDFQDIQILSQVSLQQGTTVAITQNAGKARIRGLEFEGEAALGNLRLNASVALLDAEYRSLLPGVIGIVIDSPLTYTPKTAWTLSADYTIPAGFAELTLHADYSWRSRTFFVAVPPQETINQQKAYGLINASITADIGDNLTLSVFGKNLANKRYLTRTTPIPTLGFTSAYPGDPCTYGASVTYRF